MRTGGLTRKGTLNARRQQTQDQMQETNVFKQNMANLMNIADPYQEKPRANLYSVVKNLRENSVSICF